MPAADRAKCHPVHARRKFLAVGAAYEVLSDERRRDLYDRFGDAGLQLGEEPSNPAGDGQTAGAAPARATAPDQSGVQTPGARAGGGDSAETVGERRSPPASSKPRAGKRSSSTAHVSPSGHGATDEEAPPPTLSYTTPSDDDLDDDEGCVSGSDASSSAGTADLAKMAGALENNQERLDESIDEDREGPDDDEEAEKAPEDEGEGGGDGNGCARIGGDGEGGLPIHGELTNADAVKQEHSVEVPPPGPWDSLLSTLSVALQKAAEVQAPDVIAALQLAEREVARTQAHVALEERARRAEEELAALRAMSAASDRQI